MEAEKWTDKEMEAGDINVKEEGEGEEAGQVEGEKKREGEETDQAEGEKKREGEGVGKGKVVKCVICYDTITGKVADHISLHKVTC